MRGTIKKVKGMKKKQKNLLFKKRMKRGGA